MGHVFGDSTPFPYDVNFIEQIRQAVDAGVALMLAHDEIRLAREKSVSVETLRKNERTRLAAMADALKLTMTAFMSSSSERTAKGAQRILEGARSVIDNELAGLDGHVSDTQTHGKHSVERAQESMVRALEAFTLNHDLPHTEIALQLVAGEEAYAGQAVVTTPFGIEAIFALAIPLAHAWGKPKRVLEVAGSTEVHLPAETGIFSKRVTLQPVRLDKLFITEVARSSERGMVTLRKAPRSGIGYELEFKLGERRVLLRRLAEDGDPEPTAEVIELGGEDLVQVERLWKRITETSDDLVVRRQAMTSATFDGVDLREHDDPQEIATRLINVVAPVVQEIARRSGAPGELVLRRDLGEGRREEIYLTKAELHEKVMVLPPPLRPMFDPFELSEGPRSPRAPAPSAPIYIEAEPTNPGEGVEVDLDLPKRP